VVCFEGAKPRFSPLFHRCCTLHPIFFEMLKTPVK